MAEPIGITSGLLTLATVAFQSSVALYQTIESFQSHLTRVRGLLEETEALTGVLQSLTETIRTTDLDLSTLELPLRRCGSACTEFEQELLKCSARSGGNRTSFRDWAKLRYMGDNIDGFRQLVAGYKSTIVIALADATWRKSTITAESLESYKDLVKVATDDLEAHLQSIDDKLEAVIGHATRESPVDAAELQRIQEDRLSTQKCLQICAQLSEHIDQIQRSPKDGRNSSERINPESVPEKLIGEGLEECKASLAATSQKLEKHMTDLLDRLLAKAKVTTLSEDDIVDLARLRDELDTARKCAEIFSSASLHLKENVSTIDNYGTGDAIQFMVSTDGRTIHGRNRGLGWRTRQLGGHITDASLQKISGDFTAMSFQNIGRRDSSSQDQRPAGPDESVVSSPFVGDGLTKPSAPHGDRQAGQARQSGVQQKKSSSNQAKKRLSGDDDLK